MKSIFKWLAIGATAGIGFGAGFLVAKRKYDAINKAQYDDLLARYVLVERSENSSSEPKPEEKKEEPTISPYVAQLDNLTITLTSKKEEIEETVNTNYDNMISLITPMEYGEDPTYDNITLTYYADGALARDGDDELIDNIDDVIGIDSMKYLGKYEDGVLYIKNDITRAYYEVTESDQTYFEATGYLN